MFEESMVCCERETGRQVLIRSLLLSLPSSPTRTPRARDCVLELPYTVNNQVLRNHDEEQNIKLPTYIRPYHAHLDDTGDLARLRVRGHVAGVEEVLLATQSGICGPDVHIRYPDLESRRP
jgi:hypothetical protein